MSISFIGYVLPFGQMSLWGATVITNLLSSIPSLIEFICGGYYIHNPTLKRFFILHFILPFILIFILFLHIFYLHLYSSNNPLKYNTNNKIPFLIYILYKDLYTFIITIFTYTLQSYFSISTLSHPDNSLETNPLITPLHIVPEWYFLCQYAILKGIPNKNSGFIIFLSSILILFFFAEINNLSTFTKLSTINNYFSIISFILLFISFSFIGGQLPQHNLLSYNRIFIAVTARLLAIIDRKYMTSER